MKKLLAPQLTVLLIIINLTTVFAQDSVKQSLPPKVQTAKPAVKQGVYHYKPTGYYKSKYYRKPGDTTHSYNHYATDSANAANNANVASDKSLNGQYQYLLTKVYFYQQPLLNAFHKSIMDTLNATRHLLKDSVARLSTETKIVDSLQNDIRSNDQTQSQSNARLDSIDMFGIMLPKTTYNLIMWGLVVLFAVIVIVVIGRSGSHTREAKYRVQLYNELEEEYKNYKLKANEKEKKLARELQTERNKIDELLGRG
jgi:hypothetical protein